MQPGARWEASRKFPPKLAGNKKIRMAYFYPGQFSGDLEDGEFPDPVAACFCKAHAETIQQNRSRANEKMPAR